MFASEYADHTNRLLTAFVPAFVVFLRITESAVDERQRRLDPQPDMNWEGLRTIFRDAVRDPDRLLRIVAAYLERDPVRRAEFALQLVASSSARGNVMVRVTE